MVTRLNQIEFRPVPVVIVGNVLVGNIDLGSDLFVDDLLGGQRPANFAPDVIQRKFALLQSLIELLVGIRRSNFFQSAVYFLVGGQQPQFAGTMHQDLVFDQVFQNAQAQASSLLIT